MALEQSLQDQLGSPNSDRLSISPFGPLSDRLSRQTLIYLITTLNCAFPYYDFSYVAPLVGGNPVLFPFSLICVWPTSEHTQATIPYLMAPKLCNILEGWVGIILFGPFPYFICGAAEPIFPCLHVNTRDEQS